MILVGQYDSPFVRRVAVTLHHYHMPFERNTLSVFSNAKKMQKINPLIRIPSLELASGEILINSWAILDYLDELAGPARALTPSHGPERRKVLQAVALAAGTIEKAGAVAYERHYHPKKMLSEEWEAALPGPAQSRADGTGKELRHAVVFRFAHEPGGCHHRLPDRLCETAGAGSLSGQEISQASCACRSIAKCARSS